MMQHGQGEERNQTEQSRRKKRKNKAHDPHSLSGDASRQPFLHRFTATAGTAEGTPATAARSPTRKSSRCTLAGKPGRVYRPHRRTACASWPIPRINLCTTPCGPKPIPVAKVRATPRSVRVRVPCAPSRSHVLPTQRHSADSPLQGQKARLQRLTKRMRQIWADVTSKPLVYPQRLDACTSLRRAATLPPPSGRLRHGVRKTRGRRKANGLRATVVLPFDHTPTGFSASAPSYAATAAHRHFRQAVRARAGADPPCQTGNRA